MLVYQRPGIYLGESPAWPIHEFQTVHHAFDEAVDKDPLFPNRVGWVAWAFGHATPNKCIHTYIFMPLEM